MTPHQNEKRQSHSTSLFWLRVLGPGPLSFEISIGLGDPGVGVPFAHEQIWMSETIAALALGGKFYREVPGVSFAHVDLSLWGLQGRVRSLAGPGWGRRGIEDNNYSATDTFPISELTEHPEAAAGDVLDRLLTSFDADDVLTDLVKS